MEIAKVVALLAALAGALYILRQLPGWLLHVPPTLYEARGPLLRSYFYANLLFGIVVALPCWLMAPHPYDRRAIKAGLLGHAALFVGLVAYAAVAARAGGR